MDSRDLPSKKPERRPYEPAAEELDDGYWSRPTLLSWYSSLGGRGRLAWFGGILVGANLVSLIFGFYWPRMLIVGAALLIGSLFIPSSSED
jgi:hypothetical protein